jgi:iron uptake system component EfeO
LGVQATDNRCRLDRTALDAGYNTFAITNSGSKVTEVYVYGREGDAFTKVVGEVENIGPGTSRNMTVSLGSGTYEVACKPGMTGDGIRTRITVSGTAGGAAATTSEAGHDREIELATDGKSITGLSGGATKGERVELKLTNNASGERTLEVKDPTGKVAGEREDIEPGESGELVVELDVTGDWQVIVEGKGVADVTTTLTVS